MNTSERAQALGILLNLIQKQHPMTLLFQENASITPFTKVLCFGVTRHYYQLAAIADKLVEKRPTDLNIWLCLLLGLFQISILKRPDYAIVQETVALIPHQQSWAKGFINASLRRFCREQTAIQNELSNDIRFKWMHPTWCTKKTQKDWPDHWQCILEANNAHPPLSLRVNLSRISRADYCEKLTQQQIAHQLIPYTDTGIEILEARPVQELPGFANGEFSVQDGAAQLAAPLLDLRPGLRVLDACCAPGGKLNHILESEPHLAACIGVDIEAKRLQRVRQNCERLGLQATLYTGDATHPSTWWDGQMFDRILIDAPCSATGIIRRHPDIKLLRTRDDIQTISAIQTQILTALWPLLSKDGILIYATCSIMPEENSQIIQSFLETHPDAHLQNIVQPWGQATTFGWQILPGYHGMDGFFYAKLQKTHHEQHHTTASDAE